jgi:hypothetical protein
MGGMAPLQSRAFDEPGLLAVNRLVPDAFKSCDEALPVDFVWSVFLFRFHNLVRKVRSSIVDDLIPVIDNG